VNLFVLYRLAKKCTKTYNSCRAIVQLIKSFVLRRFRCVVVCIRSLPSWAIKSHCVDVSVLCMLLYLLFKPRSHWKIGSEQKCEGAFHSGAATGKVYSIRPRKFPKFIPEFLVEGKAPIISLSWHFLFGNHVYHAVLCLCCNVPFIL